MTQAGDRTPRKETSLSFKVVRYQIPSKKIEGNLRFALLSDLHNRQHGPHNRDLLSAIVAARPDLILVAGDMTIARTSETAEGIRLLREMQKIAPVAFANGNHESKLHINHHDDFERVQAELEADGVTFLNNRSQTFSLGGRGAGLSDENELAPREEFRQVSGPAVENAPAEGPAGGSAAENAPAAVSAGANFVTGYGLEIPVDLYKKFRVQHFSLQEMQTMLGERPGGDTFSFLLAHNPQFMPTYLAWGADLVVCGHFHGGIMRLTDHQVLVSPYGFPLPRFGYGRYCDGRHTGIVTSGLGDHALDIRIHNPMELVIIDVVERKKRRKTQEGEPQDGCRGLMSDAP